MGTKVKIVNKSAYPVPAYATELSAGMDLKANITEPVTIASLERAMIPTGIYIELPEGYEAQIRPRSGLAAKFGVMSIPAIFCYKNGIKGASYVGVTDAAEIRRNFA